MSTFDVFLSHNSVDKPWASRLKDDLQRYGLSVWLDRDEIRPGDLFAKALEEGLASSRAVALIVSPEAMASGWVQEEYYRALSLTKAQAAPVQLVPVILREAEVPDFVKSRDWVDFRDESAYAAKVWELVWGITGHKPAEVLDLSAPAPITPAAPSALLPTATAPVATPPAPAFRSGGVRAGRNIQAESINVSSVEVRGADAQTAQAMLALARDLQSGGVEAGQDIIARTINVGVFRYLGQGSGDPSREQFQQELAALREQVRQAIAAGEIADEEEAEDAQTAAERAEKQATAEPPAPDKLSKNLERLTQILTQAGQTAQAAGKFGASVIKLAPIAAGLKRLVEILF
jgi:hypothetical protein